MTLDTEEMILTIVQSLEEKVDDLADGFATHEERSRNQAGRIERIERVAGAVTLAVLVAVLGVFVSGCGLLSGLIAPTPPAAIADASPKVDVVGRAVRNTVSLQTANGNTYCSGVASEGTIITAAHCVEDGEVFLVAYQGTAYPGVVIWVDSLNDLALVDAVGARLKDSVPLGEKTPSIGNKVVWMGYPLGEDFIMGTGIVGNPSVYIEGATYLAVYGQFIPGNSGGPVFNYHGELIGIISMTMTYNQNYLPVGYAVPLDTIRAAL